jgi:hypothetical protein
MNFSGPSIVGVVLVTLAASLGASGALKAPTIIVRKATMVAFFPPVPASGEYDSDTNDDLSDFQYYLSGVREPLRKAGIDLHEVYSNAFFIRVGKSTTQFRPKQSDVGYYFIAPDKKPRIEYGIMTDEELLEAAHEYFGIAVEGAPGENTAEAFPTTEPSLRTAE